MICSKTASLGYRVVADAYGLYRITETQPTTLREARGLLPDSTATESWRENASCMPCALLEDTLCPEVGLVIVSYTELCYLADEALLPSFLMSFIITLHILSA